MHSKNAAADPFGVVIDAFIRDTDMIIPIFVTPAGGGNEEGGYTGPRTRYKFSESGANDSEYRSHEMLFET